MCNSTNLEKEVLDRENTLKHYILCLCFETLYHPEQSKREEIRNFIVNDLKIITHKDIAKISPFIANAMNRTHKNKGEIKACLREMKNKFKLSKRNLEELKSIQKSFHAFMRLHHENYFKYIQYSIGGGSVKLIID